MTKEVKTGCAGSSHCILNTQGEVLPDIVAEASKCVGDFLALQVRMIGGCPGKKTAFDAATEPLIAIASYFARICTYSRITPETTICAYINLKKVCQNHPQYELTNFNVHRLLVASMMVFAKYYDDDIDSNARWSRIAGVAIHELNSLEVDFLNLCQFDLRVPYDIFHDTLHDLMCYHHHEPIRTQVPMFNPTASFYPRKSGCDNIQSTPSPPCTMTATPKSRFSVSSFTRHSSQHHVKDDSDHHSKDDSSESSNPHRRRRNLNLLVNLFHRHHHHKGHKEGSEEASHVVTDMPCENTTLQFQPMNPFSSSASISPPTSPRDLDHQPRVSSGKMMSRNHSTLSLSGLMHALSPGSKPFVRKTFSSHQIEPEVDK
eukprot:c13049_g3_i1.p1 GENE.c13049_g3_i1~~c13049_g3_i1.p1  ORF type:complete len:374 (-),score=50.67 c13049_g3_i1:251-1372(-)